MENKKNLGTKARYLMSGIVIGAIIMTSTLVFAYTPINAWIENNISFYFNGEYKALPDGYDVIVYNGRTYTPAKFIAEELGADVEWDESTKSVLVTYEEKSAIDVVDNECKDQNKDEDKGDSKPVIDRSNYKKLPLYNISPDAQVMVTAIAEENNVTTVYIEVENRGNIPIQLRQNTAKIITEEKTHYNSDLKSASAYVDTRWYSDIREDERMSGWVRFPLIPDDAKYINLSVEIIKNDGSGEVTEFEFDIAL